MRSRVLCAGLLLVSLRQLDAAGAPVLASFEPQPLPAGHELVNPLRSFYTWLGNDFVPLPSPSLDRYKRFAWGELEAAPGAYDFSPIDKELASLPKGTKFAFRIMALNSTWALKDGGDVPPYLVKSMRKGFFVQLPPRSDKGPERLYIPDWNDSYFLDRVDALLAALGKKYDGDPRIAWVDIGIYGNWGEWHVFGLPGYLHGSVPYGDRNTNTQGATPGTLETRERIVRAHLNAFRKTRLIMMTDDKEALAYALRAQTATPVGMRRDSFGSDHFAQDFIPSGMPEADRELVRNRWKTAPLIVESFGGSKSFEVGAAGLVSQVEEFHISAIGNGNFGQRWEKLASEQQRGLAVAGRRSGYCLRIDSIQVSRAPGGLSLETRWIDSGVAPVYDRWNVVFTLTAAGPGGRTAQIASSVNLTAVLPGPNGAPVVDLLPAPSLPPGRYELRVSIQDRAGYLPPLHLAQAGEQPDGSYALGEVVVH